MLNKFPGYTGILSTVSAWATVDFLRMSQITAAVMAGLVSFATFLIILPKIPDALAKVPEAHKKGIHAIKDILRMFKRG